MDTSIKKKTQNCFLKKKKEEQKQKQKPTKINEKINIWAPGKKKKKPTCWRLRGEFQGYFWKFISWAFPS